jgi:hypothetical protein
VTLSVNVAQVSRELEKDCVVVFDEAHNIDNVCIEALSVNLRDKTLSAAARNLTSLQTAIQRSKQNDAERLQQEYRNLVQGLHSAGVLSSWRNDSLANPALPQDILNEAVPGNIRRYLFACCSCMMHSSHVHLCMHMVLHHRCHAHRFQASWTTRQMPREPGICSLEWLECRFVTLSRGALCQGLLQGEAGKDCVLDTTL